jgi:hypothetical protein
MSTGSMRRIALCGVLATASIMGSSCAGTAETVVESSEKPLQAEKGPTTGIVIVEKDRSGVPLVEQRVRYASTHAFIGPLGVSAPMGRILLMRRGPDLCAIRFTEFHRTKDAPSGLFTRGGPSLYAEYDWYDLTAPKVQSGHRQLSNKPGYGIPLTFPVFTGSPWVKCRSFEPTWSYPNAVRFIESNELRDYGIELAPTSWRDVAEIDLAHPRLRWYRYDEKREPILVPLGDLPQAKGQ